MNKYYSVYLSLLMYCLSAKNIYAQVVINEIFPNPEGRSEPNEFIELINLSEEQIDIQGYKIQDASGKEYVIGSVTLDPMGFAVFRKEETKVALNNDEDDVVLKDDNNNILDSYFYQGTTEDKSWSRFPDGTGEFVNGTEVSEGYANHSPPTPTPQPTSKPTSTPKPTKTPRPTSTPRLTRTTSGNASDSRPSVVLGESDKVADAGVTNKEDQQTATHEVKINKTKRVNNSDMEKGTKTESETEFEQKQQDGYNSHLGSGLFILGGLGFIGAAGYPIIKRKGYKDIFK